MIAVLGLVGLLASVLTLLVTGMATEAADGGCIADARALNIAAVTYLTTNDLQTIPAAGSDADRFEQTLVTAGNLSAPSTRFDLTSTGALIPSEDSSC